METLNENQRKILLNQSERERLALWKKPDHFWDKYPLLSRLISPIQNRIFAIIASMHKDTGDMFVREVYEFASTFGDTSTLQPIRRFFFGQVRKHAENAETRGLQEFYQARKDAEQGVGIADVLDSNGELLARTPFQIRPGDQLP